MVPYVDAVTLMSVLLFVLHVDDRIGFGLYQSCGKRGSVGHVSVFELWRCWRGRGLGTGFGKIGWGYICVSCESGFFVSMARPDICILC